MMSPSRVLQNISLSVCLAGIGLMAQGLARPPYSPPASSPRQKPAPPTSTPKTAREERDAAIAADTQKLYQLAEELKAEVAKSSKDTLSLSVIRKAEEIEKLAHSLRERMKKE